MGSCTVHRPGDDLMSDVLDKDRIRAMGKAYKAIRDVLKADPKQKLGVVDCPMCGGRLHYNAVSVNKHIHGYCETRACLRWIH
jgi:hypothetical protein